MAGSEEAPSKMGSTEVPPASDRPSDGSAGGSSSQGRGKQRFSSTGKFLQSIFCRLMPPFSPNPKSSSPTTSPSTQTQPPLQTQIQSTSGEPEMAAIPTRLSLSRAKDGNGLSSPLSGVAAPTAESSKENRSPASAVAVPSAALAKLSVEDAIARPRSSASVTRDKCGTPGEKPIHQIFMDQALDMARLALRTNETPVGCVLVHNGKVIARGMNATNVTRNGTRHAEFMALSALLSYRPDNSEEAAAAQLQQQANERAKADVQDDEPDLFPMDDEYVKQGHLYPYGQKLHRVARVDRSIVRECILYVTVEPCVMCAGLLRQLGIQKVYFGAVNDKFGGTGGVFSIHKNSADTHRHTSSTSASKPLQASTNASNLPRPVSSSSGRGSLNSGRQETPGGDGGNVEPGFEAEGGWGRDEAVSLLRRFYVQENGRAPVPRKKEGRAARLAAMEQAGSEAAAAPAPLSSGAETGDDAGADSNGSEASKP